MRMQKVFHYTLISVHRGKQTEGNIDNTLMFKDTFFLAICEAPQPKESAGFSKKLGFDFWDLLGFGDSGIRNTILDSSWWGLLV